MFVETVKIPHQREGNWAFVCREVAFGDSNYASRVFTNHWAFLLLNCRVQFNLILNNLRCNDAGNCSCSSSFCCKFCNFMGGGVG